MHKQVVILVVVFTTMVHCDTKYHDQVGDYTPVERTIEFNYVNPCWQLGKIAERNPYHSIHLAMVKNCEDVYKLHWIKSVENVLSCKPTRTKRQVVALAGGVMRAVATAGTNFLVSKFVNFKMPRKEMIDMLYYALDYEKIFTTTIGKIIGLTSESSIRHQEQTTIHGDAFPRTLWLSTTIIGEILANSANLDVIAYWCRHGRVATTELGELTENLRLQTMDSDNLEMRKISLGESDETLVFTFVEHTGYSDLNPIQQSISNETIRGLSENKTITSYVFYTSSAVLILVLYVIIVLLLMVYNMRKLKRRERMSQSARGEVQGETPVQRENSIPLAYLQAFD